MGQFKPEPKMKTTEPSVELKLKKGGNAKKMANGGYGMVAPMPAPRARRPVAPVARQAMPALLRKKGGEAESPKEHKAEMKALGKVEKELKTHEGKPASKAHKGLKCGGMTGGIEGRGYKKGGKASGSEIDAYESRSALKPKINAQDKVVSAKQVKGFNTKTGGVESVRGKKFANGGTVANSVANRYKNTLVVDGSKMPNKTGKTGQIKQTVAGYKDGGHVAMTCKSVGGFTAKKKMAKC